MSFIDTYLAKFRLSEMPNSIKDNLINLEQKLIDTAQQDNSDFQECLKQFGPQLSDLVERLSGQLSKFPKISLGNVFSVFRFVINIGIEVYQLTDKMSECVLKNIPPEKLHATKVEFGQQLTYFIWMIVDPLNKYLNWIPLKKTIEKKLVLWLAKYALEATVDLFAVNQGVKTFSIGETQSHIKTL